MVSDARSLQIRLEAISCSVDSLVLDQSDIPEVLNCAWGMHEMTRDGMQEGLSFLLTSS